MSVSTPLIAINNESYAHLLANYLTSQQLIAHVLPSQKEGEYVIVLEDDAKVEDAKAICEEFLRQPRHPKYQQAAWESGEQVALHPSHTNNLKIGNLMNWAKEAPLAASVLFICTLVYALSWLGFFGYVEQYLKMQPFGQLQQTHEYWRLITPAFIHFSAIHFIFNVLWWSMIGSQIERIFGFTMLLVVFLVSAVASNLAQAIVSGPAFGGLSGVVYAVLGFAWWIGWLKPSWGLYIPKSIVIFMLIWLVLGYTDVLWVNMANTAHTVGLISGCLIAAVLALGAGRRKPA
ncbi:rhomboid family intramembrane serine protease GlpG [Alteromonas confluentis]|uniref:Rhomboid family intramembrane serine protease GlpG n=1 Tax=Alteromonas confluentis TaxID=1656094 RepID=A0A1E7ZA91_9ALTE|nr:rhomboid family intramembrane serine protease GlpG [Alteromonas confluentis]